MRFVLHQPKLFHRRSFLNKGKNFTVLLLNSSFDAALFFEGFYSMFQLSFYLLDHLAAIEHRGCDAGIGPRSILGLHLEVCRPPFHQGGPSYRYEIIWRHTTVFDTRQQRFIFILCLRPAYVLRLSRKYFRARWTSPSTALCRCKHHPDGGPMRIHTTCGLAYLLVHRLERDIRLRRMPPTNRRHEGLIFILSEELTGGITARWAGKTAAVKSHRPRTFGTDFGRIRSPLAML